MKELWRALQSINKGSACLVHGKWLTKTEIAVENTDVTPRNDDGCRNACLPCAATRIAA